MSNVEKSVELLKKSEHKKMILKHEVEDISELKI